MSNAITTATGLWLALIASGIYHGLSPGMGWPLAVSAGLMERRAGALAFALLPLAAGHLLAMLLVLLPFSLLATLVDWRSHIQGGAGLLLIGAGAFLLISRRHPRALARIKPAQLGLWSFAVAMAHGAGLMLVPIYLGLCGTHGARFGPMIAGDAGMAILVAAVHSAAMVLAGGAIAWLVYRHLGLKFLSRSWYNLEALWALSLILVGTSSLVATFSLS